MKKYYQTTIKIPERVSIEKKRNFLKISGPLGSTHLHVSILDPLGLGALSYNPVERELYFRTLSRSYFGLFQTFLQNKIVGVTQGFLVYLKITGIGFRSLLNKNLLILKLGFSHDIVVTIPSGIRIFLYEPTLICLFGLDKNQVTQIAAKIRSSRPPSVYKGKGIRILPEKVVLKQGKRK